MRARYVIVLVCAISLYSLSSFGHAQWGSTGAWDSLVAFLRDAHTWSGTQTFPNVKVESVTLSADKIMTAADLGKTYDVTVPVKVKLPSPSTTTAGYTPTRFNTRSGVTLFVDPPASIGSSGTTIFSSDTGAAIDAELTGVSVVTTTKTGSFFKW